MENSFPIRVGVNAIIESENRLLAVKFDDDSGLHYNLPGGGVKTGECITDGLIREVREETTADVNVGELEFVYEYFPPANEHRYGSAHKLTLFFRGHLSGTSTPTLPESPDPNQVGIEWLSLESIEEEPLVPDLGSTWKRIADPQSTHRFVQA